MARRQLGQVVFLSLSHKRRASIGADVAFEIMVYAAELHLSQRDQPLLMPVDMREWLPEDDLVFIVLDAVAALDLGGFRR
jgi:hypothetical protein